MMSTRSILLILGILLVVGTAAGLLVYHQRPGPIWEPDTYEVERTEYHPPRLPEKDVLTDDQLEDKKPVPFNPALADRRPLGRDGAWLLNASTAVIRLDVPLI